MDEYAHQNATPAKKTAVVVKARQKSVTALRAAQKIGLHADQAKRRAHQRVEPFWQATAISIFVTLGFYAWTLQMIGVEYAWTVGVIAIGSGIVQEIGHWQTMVRTGHSAHFLFLPWLVILLPKNPEKYEAASRWHKSLVAVFGPMINGLLITLGLLIFGLPDKQIVIVLVSSLSHVAENQVWPIAILNDLKFFQILEWLVHHSPEWDILGRIIASVNAGIATMSLLPIPFLDGGKLLKHLLESVGVAQDRLIAASISTVVMAIAGTLFLLGHFHPYPVAAIIGTGWLLKRHHKEAHLESLAMTKWQAWTIFVVWLSLFSFSLTVFLLVPATIKPENTQRALEILSQLWRSLT